MIINELTAKLKEAAVNATAGEWCADDYHGVVAEAGLNGNYYIASCSGPDHRSNKRFIALASPANVLALIDALEAAEKRNAELMEKQRLIDICQGQGLEHRIAAEKRAEAAEKRIAVLTAERDALREGEMGDAKHSNTRAAADIYFQLVEECDIPPGGSLVGFVDALKARIAELEAREVKLSKLSVDEVMHLSGFSRDYAEGWCAGNDNARHEIQVAGIRLGGLR